MKNPIAKYLMCAFAYYQLDTNLIPDSEFDQLAKDILANYDNIEHMHKHLVTKKDLDAGTYLGEYPNIVISATHDYIKTNNI
jgi:NAD-dependent DNA ligase|tara:strand:- start:277 stop:522 length:246 start_codon:yes stop_codon:yes gene_type:complete